MIHEDFVEKEDHYYFAKKFKPKMEIYLGFCPDFPISFEY